MDIYTKWRRKKTEHQWYMLMLCVNVNGSKLWQLCEWDEFLLQCPYTPTECVFEMKTIFKCDSLSFLFAVCVLTVLQVKMDAQCRHNFINLNECACDVQYKLCDSWCWNWDVCICKVHAVELSIVSLKNWWQFQQWIWFVAYSIHLSIHLNPYIMQWGRFFVSFFFYIGLVGAQCEKKWRKDFYNSLFFMVWKCGNRCCRKLALSHFRIFFIADEIFAIVFI